MCAQLLLHPRQSSVQRSVHLSSWVVHVKVVTLLCPRTLANFWQLRIEHCAYLQSATALFTQMWFGNAGVHGLYVQPLQDEADMGSPTNMQAD